MPELAAGLTLLARDRAEVDIIARFLYPGRCHVFDGLAPEVSISRQFIDDFHRSIKRACKASK